MITNGKRQEADMDQAAFDLWLHRGLMETYGAVLREPVPDELLRLLDDGPDQD